MSVTTENKKDYIVGGSFLTEEHGLDSLFTPEDINDEQQMIVDTVKQFVDGEIVPKLKDMETGDNAITVGLLKQCGELGLLAAEIPESYGGTEIDKCSAAFLVEEFSRSGGFAVSYGGHTGIGTMPITYFGNEAQKEKYLPSLATGELLAAYALTETSSGSDALNAKTKAVLSADGKHYILNGNKMWITNAGFADIFIVFAKIDGKDFSAFIVEKSYPGVSLGAEEKKMGIKSSSTRLLILEDVHVPVENLLGEAGKGHKIAFNILNIGRFKLGAANIGGSKYTMALAASYANERKAFGKSISEFRLIQYKLSEMAIRNFAGESAVYRTSGNMDHLIGDLKHGMEGAGEKILKCIEEYAIECAIIKVAGSEILSYVADEAVQIHGGYGYSQEYEVERVYRDARINRIFEGTNEINRLLMIDMLIKRAMQGNIPLIQKAQELMGELLGMPSFDFDEDDGVLAEEKKILVNAKKAVIFLAGAGFQKYMQEIEQEQELLAMAADLLIDTYLMESMLMRTLKQIERAGEDSAALMIAATRVFFHDAIERMSVTAKTGLTAIAEGDELMTMMAALRRLMKHKPFNTIQLRRQIAAAAIEVEGYPF